MFAFVSPLLMLQTDPQAAANAAGPIAMVFTVIWLAVAVVMIAAMWKVFEKAGEPGWAAIVPIYNLYILLKIAGKPAWWIVLMLIPFVNLIVWVIAMIAVAARFGKGTGFGLGLAFLGLIFFPMLAWGDAQPSAMAPGMA
jgi:hypothetical protein